jgi:hypothetical protein
MACGIAHRAAGVEGQVLTEDKAMLRQRLDHDLAERTGLGHRRGRVQRAEMIDPARRLGRRPQGVGQCGPAEQSQEFASPHRGTLLLDAMLRRRWTQDITGRSESDNLDRPSSLVRGASAMLRLP